MASAKFLEEALSTDVDESAVSAIVGSLEDQLSTSTPAILQPQNISNSPHLNNNNNITTTNASAISNGGNKQQQFLQHATIPNGGEPPPQPTTTSQFITSTGMPKDGIKLIYPQQQQQQQQPRFPNGTISTATTKQLVTLKTSVGSGQQGLVSVGTATASMPTVVSSMTLGAKPLNNVTSVTNATNAVGATLVGGQQTMVSTAQGAGTPNVLPTNVQIVNVRPQGQPQGQKTTTVPPRVVLGGPHMIGARPGQSITLQSLQQLQPGQQGHLLLKTENGQYQLLRVGPAPPQQQAGAHLQQSSAGTITTQTQGTVSGPQQTTYRLQTVPAVSRLNTTQFTGPPLTIRKTIVQQGSTTIATSLTSTTVTQNANIITNVSNTSTPAVTPGTPIVTQTTPKQSLDNTKEKCRKFLANLLELSSREPKNVEKNVRTLIQELIDTKVEPEEFCDRLERLLNASPQPCLIGFLKKSLPLLRLSLVMKEMVIDGIKPPPSHVVFSVANTPTVTTVVQGMRQQSPAQIRLMAPQAGTVVRPAVQARMATPTTIRGQAPRMITAAQLRPQFQTNNVIVPTSQPPALHPVSGAPPLFPTSATPVRVQCVKSQIQQIRQPLQQHQQQQPIIQTISQIPQIRPTNITPVRTTTPKQVAKPSVPSITTKQQTSQKKFVTTVASTASSSSAAYVPDDDINDVAAMGGVNLAEETQRILGSTEFVGQQIRSCKDELFLQSGPLQNRLRQITAKEGLEEASGDVVAIVSHATQELLKNLVEKLALITAHRIEIVKTDSRYEVTQDVRGQLKFLEELDRAERKRHDEQERELLLRAAKSRSKNEDPEQAKLKAKAKEMQRAEMEELRQREANLTALQAIGPRKKPRLDNDSGTGSTQVNAGASGSGLSGGRSQIPLRPRLKRANIRDLLCLLEQEKDKCKSTMLYKAYLK